MSVERAGEESSSRSRETSLMVSQACLGQSVRGEGSEKSPYVFPSDREEEQNVEMSGGGSPLSVPGPVTSGQRARRSGEKWSGQRHDEGISSSSSSEISNVYVLVPIEEGEGM